MPAADAATAASAGSPDAPPAPALGFSRTAGAAPASAPAPPEAPAVSPPGWRGSASQNAASRASSRSCPSSACSRSAPAGKPGGRSAGAPTAVGAAPAVTSWPGAENAARCSSRAVGAAAGMPRPISTSCQQGGGGHAAGRERGGCMGLAREERPGRCAAGLKPRPSRTWHAAEPAPAPAAAAATASFCCPACRSRPCSPTHRRRRRGERQLSGHVELHQLSSKAVCCSFWALPGLQMEDGVPRWRSDGGTHSPHACLLACSLRLAQGGLPLPPPVSANPIFTAAAHPPRVVAAVRSPLGTEGLSGAADGSEAVAGAADGGARWWRRPRVAAAGSSPTPLPTGGPPWGDAAAGGACTAAAAASSCSRVLL